VVFTLFFGQLFTCFALIAHTTGETTVRLGTRGYSSADALVRNQNMNINFPVILSLAALAALILQLTYQSPTAGPYIAMDR